MATTTPTGLGRRKTSVAKVRLVDNVTTRTVNGIKADEYFPTVDMQKAWLSPLEATSQHDVFGFEAKVFGGGKRSQADALKLAIARALLKDNVARRRQLKD